MGSFMEMNGKRAPGSCGGRGEMDVKCGLCASPSWASRSRMCGEAVIHCPPSRCSLLVNLQGQFPLLYPDAVTGAGSDAYSDSPKVT